LIKREFAEVSEINLYKRNSKLSKLKSSCRMTTGILPASLKGKTASEGRTDTESPLIKKRSSATLAILKKIPISCRRGQSEAVLTGRARLAKNRI
jgi:hypothetical protein